MINSDHNKEIGRLEGRVEALQGDIGEIKDDLRRLFERMDEQSKELAKLSTQRNEIVKLMRAFMDNSKDQRKFVDETRRKTDVIEERLKILEQDGCANVHCKPEDAEIDQNNPPVFDLLKTTFLQGLKWVAVVSFIMVILWIFQRVGVGLNVGSPSLPTVPSP